LLNLILKCLLKKYINNESKPNPIKNLFSSTEDLKKSKSQKINIDINKYMYSEMFEYFIVNFL